MSSVGLLLGGIERSFPPGWWGFPVHVRGRDVVMIDVVVHVVGVRWWIVDHLVVDDLWLGELEDDHRSGQDHRQQTQGHGLPGLQGDQSQSQRHQHSRFELDAQQEGDHDFLNKATACKRMNLTVITESDMWEKTHLQRHFLRSMEQRVLRQDLPA